MSLVDPAYISLPRDDEAVRRFLTFQDRQVHFQMKKMRGNYRWKNSDPEGFREKYEELKAHATRCLIDTWPTGQTVTYSGLWQDLQTRFGWGFDLPPLDIPEPRIIPWAKMPHEPRYYQNDATNALLKVRHGGIELPTGSGKSLILQMIAKARPVQTVIVTPSAGITDQLYKDFSAHFGQKYVGKYGDGSKKFDKLFTVAVAQSLVRCEPGSDAWNKLAQTKQILWDESHTTPAETFDSVCTGLFRNVPFRYFVSATQLRTDGSEMVLKGITGPIIYRKNFRELVDEHFLAQPRVRIFNVKSSGGTNISDVKEETRRQLYLNPNVNSLIARTAAKMINGLDRQVVILVEEFKQFNILKNYMTVPFTFVHGGTTKETREFLEEQYHKCDIDQAVVDFNKGKIKCLIGTSAISTGIDLQPTGCLIYAQGGTSEIKLRQAVGRGTRLVPGKEDFFVVDFRIIGSDSMERHAEERLNIYHDMTDDVQEIT